MSDTPKDTTKDTAESIDSVREIMNAIEHPNDQSIPDNTEDSDSTFPNAITEDLDSMPADAPIEDPEEEDSEDEGAYLPPTERSEKDKAEDRRLRAESFRIMANVGNFGLFLIIALFFGYFIGHGMDKFFHTRPFFTIFWIVCAVAASIKELVVSIQKAKKLAEPSPSTESPADKDSKEHV